MSINRRDFLTMQQRDDRVLVVVFLRGGADGLTLVPPVGDDLYRSARPTLRVEPGDAIRLDDDFWLNARLGALMPWFESGDMTVIHGAGSEDETRSHFEAQDFMEHAGDSGGGWLARFLRAQSPTPAPLCAVSIGTTLPESLRGAPGGAVIQTISDFAIAGADEAEFTHELLRLYDHETGQLGRTARDTIEAIRRLRALRSEPDQPSGGAVYPQTTFGRGLREIARLIKADVGLVASTIDLGNWDTHFTQGVLIGSLMRQLAGGIDAFLTDLGQQRKRVTVVTMTEFGRRVRENTSRGTDHGLASVMFTFGATRDSGLAGGRVISGWRGLSEDDLTGPGDVPMGINYRDVLSPLLMAHAPGLDPARVFPGHQGRSLPVA